MPWPSSVLRMPVFRRGPYILPPKQCGRNESNKGEREEREESGGRMDRQMSGTRVGWHSPGTRQV